MTPALRLRMAEYLAKRLGKPMDQWTSREVRMLIRDQEPLGTEFSEAIFSDLDGLYEN